MRLIRKSKLAFSGILSGFLLSVMLASGIASPLNANTCNTTCKRIYDCTLLMQKADAATIARVKRNKTKVIQNCVKGCKKNVSAAVGCYKKSGPKTNLASCQSIYGCMLPYLQQ